MVAVAEGPSDLRVGEVGHVAGDVHGDLPGVHQRPAPAASGDLVEREVEHVGGGFEDGVDGDRRLGGVANQVGQHPFGQIVGARLAADAGVGSHLDEGALELADGVGDVLRDEPQHVAGDLDGCRLGPLLEDGQPGDQVRRLDVGHEAGLEAAAEPVLQRGDRVG